MVALLIVDLTRTPTSVIRCFKINPADNVATMLDATPGQGPGCRSTGPIQVLGETSTGTLTLQEPIELGHKIALCDIPVGQPIIKFGVTIGQASQPIRAGQWVHLHNCKSTFDERSGTLDNQTGAPTDTKYV